MGASIRCTMFEWWSMRKSGALRCDRVFGRLIFNIYCRMMVLLVRFDLQFAAPWLCRWIFNILRHDRRLVYRRFGDSKVVDCECSSCECGSFLFCDCCLHPNSLK